MRTNARAADALADVPMTVHLNSGIQTTTRALDHKEYICLTARTPINNVSKAKFAHACAESVLQFAVMAPVKMPMRIRS